jgi:PEGA domain/Anaphase-promoting complex, cyclosome, subunit 3
VFSLVGVLASEARAADKTVGVAETAKAHYKQGRMHYQLGEYREALKEFKEAYRLKQDPSFLYNIAQCHRQLHEYSEAIKLYGNYLREAPDADNRDEVERQIRDLKAAAEKQQRQEQASAQSVAPVLPPEPIRPLPPAPVAASTSAAPVPSAAPTGTAASAFPAPNPDASRDGQLEVIPDPPEANILVNHIAVARRGPVKLRLPPGLYSVALEREGFRGAEGAVTLVAGEHATLAGTLTETKSHGWRYPGVGLLVLGVASEVTAIYSHVEADRYRKGSADFNTYASWEKWTQGVAISAAVLAATSWVVDWLVNRDKADPGPPNPLLPAPTEMH